MKLFYLLALISAVESNNLTRSIRQVDPRFKYTCGSDPLRFYSEIPCNMYPLCRTGGFKIYVGCSNDYQCQIHQADTQCIDSCCCTIPRFVGVPATTQKFRDQSAGLLSNLLPLIISLIFLQ